MRQDILIVDDEPINLSVLKNTLNPTYVVRACKSGAEALRALEHSPLPDLILLDIMMPGMDGYTTLDKIRENRTTREIPVIFISSLDGNTDEEKGFSLGAVDYITKPFRPAIVMARVTAHLELKQARDSLKNQNEWLEAEVERRVNETQLIQDATLGMITQLAETRDTDTAHHILRTRSYVELLGRRLQASPRHTLDLDDSTLVRIVKASPLHDIGKIGIPDLILLKPGKLTSEEFEVMKTHCRIGGDAIRNAMNQAMLMNREQLSDEKPMSLLFLETAELITANHHEKWDGSGYPNGLRGGEIPFPARLMALADVYDALTTPRVYKAEWPVSEANQYILQQKGQHFDPEVVDAFEAEAQSFERIKHLMADDQPGGLYERG